MNFGVAWYPEQWSEERWLEDLRLMREANFNTVRLAEFAWSTLEPEEGRFELDWLERAINLAAEHGLEVVLGIPTAAPPAWLTQTYPEVLQLSETGQRATHGYRQHYSPSSPTYRRLARTITEQMAARFGRDTRIIGWQVDNEFSAPSFDKDTHAQFQGWLKQAHDSVIAGHWGIKGTWEKIKRAGWPVKFVDVKHYVESCGVCQRIKPLRKRPAGLLLPTEVPHFPFQMLSLD